MGQSYFAEKYGRNTEEKFWTRVKSGATEECWPWTARKGADGYGVYKFHGRDLVASRLAWQFTNGPIPDGLCVCHRCDNPGCCNPAHLFLGTHKENMDDRDRKGRSLGSRNRGEANPMAKLSAEQALAIRADGGSSLEIAQRFGVSRSCVLSIKRRDSWGHI